MKEKIINDTNNSETTSIGLYFQEVDDGPLLTREEEVALAKTVDLARYRDKGGKINFKKLWRDDVDKKTLHKAKRAREKMIESNLRLVAGIAKKYQNRGCDIEDLIQEGNIGLIRGIDGYDYKMTYVDENGQEKNNKLSTYCTAWIHQKISRLIQNQSKTVRIPVHVQTLSTKVKKLVEDYISLNGYDPSIDEIFEKINQDEKSSKKTKEAIKQALKCHLSKTISLDETYSPNGEGDESLYNCIPDENVDLENHIFRTEMEKAVREVMSNLSPREEKIARLRFGIGENENNHNSKPITKEEFEELRRIAKNNGVCNS